MNDIVRSYDTLEEVREYIKIGPYDFYEIVDRDTWETVEE